MKPPSGPLLSLGEDQPDYSRYRFPYSVKVVHTGTSTRIEPPLDDTWHRDTKLQWHAAVTSCETGLDVLTYPSSRTDYGYRISNRTGTFHESGAGYRFPFMWVLLNGFATGVRAKQRDNTKHGPDLCGYDFDELADLARIYERDPSTASVAEDLRQWFGDNGLDMRTLGGRPDIDPEQAAFNEWGPP